MPGLGGLAGLGNALTGYNAEYDQSIKQLGDIAFGKTLQALSGQQNPTMPGMTPQGMPPQQGQPGPPGGGMPPPQIGQPPSAPPQMPQGGPPGPLQQPASPQSPVGQGQAGGGPMPSQQPPMMPQQQGFGQQVGPQGAQLNWQSIFQKVKQANPQAPPQVLAAAVNRFLPLMNQQSQQEWKQVELQMREMQMQNQQAMGQMRLDQGEQRIGMEADRINSMRQAYGLPPISGDQAATTGAGGQGKPQETGPEEIADAIKNGTQPPTLTGLYRQGPAVRAALAKDGFDLSKANMEWQRATKQIQALNGPQMTRFVGLAQSVNKTIDEAVRLSEQMKLSGVPAVNRLELQSYVQTQGNTPGGQLASQYLAAVNTLKEEVANLASGGYAPTDASWSLANSQVNENYGVYQLPASLKEMQRLINYRLQGIPGIEQEGAGAPNRYTNSKTGEPQDKAGWSQDSGAKKNDPLGIR